MVLLTWWRFDAQRTGGFQFRFLALADLHIFQGRAGLVPHPVVIVGIGPIDLRQRNHCTQIK